MIYMSDNKISLSEFAKRYLDNQPFRLSSMQTEFIKKYVKLKGKQRLIIPIPRRIGGL